jgi:phosphoribosylaminoimidazole carboxylase PurE protein
MRKGQPTEPRSRKPKVSIVMGSDSDLPVMAECCKVLDLLQVPYEVRVLSAHRTPAAAGRHAAEAQGRGIEVIVAGAGGAAHLAGAMAAHSPLPVIAVPVDSTPLLGLDALLSSVQMPPGVPVACVAVGKMGAANAGHLAAQILALHDMALARRVALQRELRGAAVLERDRELPSRLRELLKR